MERELQFRSRGLFGGYFYLIPSGHGLLCLVIDGILRFQSQHEEGCKTTQGATFHFWGVDAGFGYIPSTYKYNQVHLYNQNEDDLSYFIKCEIITISDGGAVSSNTSREECPMMVSAWGVLSSNKFYWMVWEGYCPTLNQLIISLDLEPETFEFIPHPLVPPYVEGNDMFLVERQAQLCLIDTFAHPPDTNVWILKDPVNKVWVKEYTMDLTKVVRI